MSEQQPYRRRPAPALVLLLAFAGCGGGGGGGGSTPPPNRAPTANAGADQVVVESDIVTLSATGSSDSDGSIQSYAWAQTDGEAVTLTGADTVSASFDAPVTDVPLALIFEVTVTDNDGDSASATTTVTVNPNVPPAVNAGTDQEAVESDTVTLDATVSDDDGTIASYAWTQTGGPAVTLSDATTEDTSFTAPVVSAITELTFQLTATDNTGDTTSDSIVVGVNPNEPPELALHFPCAGCRYYGASMSVTGSTTSGADNSYVAALDSVSSITVNAGGQAIDALVQVDGEWIAQNVPVVADAGAFTISISATDSYGETTTETLDLAYAPTLASVLVAHDKVVEDRAYLFDTQISGDRLFSGNLASGELTEITNGLFPSASLEQILDIAVDQAATQVFLCGVDGKISVIDLNTGALSILSGASTGTGPLLDEPEFIDIDDDDGRLIVYDFGLQSLFAVDTVTGNRTLLAANGGDAGSGPNFTNVLDMRIDAAGDIAYIAVNTGTYLAVDLTTGDRTTLPFAGPQPLNVKSIAFDEMRSLLAVFSTADDDVYSYTVPAGNSTLLSDGSAMLPFNVSNAARMTIDAVADRYVLNDYAPDLVVDSDRLLSVDPATGERAVLFTDALGAGPQVDGPAQVALDADDSALYVADAGGDRVLRVELASGDRTVISDATTGSGAAFSALRGIELDTAGNRAFVTDSDNALLIAVALDTGNRSTISGGVIGSGVTLDRPSSVRADMANNRLLVLDEGLPAVIAISLASGERTIISDASNSGPVLNEPYGLALDSSNERVLITEIGDGSTPGIRLLAVDLATGDRTTLSGAGVGDGPFFDSLRDIALLEGGNYAAVGAQGGIYLVNLANGDRQKLVDAVAGNGEAIFSADSLAYDANRDVIYTWEAWFDAGFAVDVKTGDRVVISK